jgi:predicted MFS family arabinose efflux permease
MVREIHLRVGVGWASRSLCFVFLALLGLSNMILRDRRPPGKRKTRSLVDPAAFRDWPYLLFVLGCCVVFLGIYTPFVHIQSFTLQQDIASPSLSLYILSILNASSILGRILPNLITNRVGPLNMIIITSLALSASTFGLLAVSDLAPLLVVAVVFGFFTGTFFSLMPTIFVRLSPDPAMIGTRFGMAFAAMSVPLLFGPPIAGALFGEKAGYHGSWIWAGAVMAVGGGVILGSRILKARVLSTQGSGIMTVL